MKVLSLFDGMSCGLQALKEAGIPVEVYYASEIDKYAIQIAKKNHPEIIELWDVTKWREWNLWKIDMIIGGSPCQDLSIAGKRAWLDWARSWLFWDMVDIIAHYKPKYFLLENVASMSKENKAIITEAMWVEPILINSALLTAQNRKRLYWTNIPWITQPEDKGIVIKDILEDEVDDKYYLSNEVFEKLKVFESNGRLEEWKCRALTTMQWWHRQPKILWNKYNDRIMDEKSWTIWCYNWLTNKQWQMVVNDRIRKLTPTECERLQWVRDWYTEWVSNSQRYKMIGNWRTVPVIIHIFSFIK
jgi:DNA-cytosine methyltransferase